MPLLLCIQPSISCAGHNCVATAVSAARYVGAAAATARSAARSVATAASAAPSAACYVGTAAATARSAARSVATAASATPSAPCYVDAAAGAALSTTRYVDSAATGRTVFYRGAHRQRRGEPLLPLLSPCHCFLLITPPTHTLTFTCTFVPCPRLCSLPCHRHHHGQMCCRARALVLMHR